MQHLEQVVGDDAQERHDGQTVAAMDPASVVFLPLDVQPPEAVVLDTPVRPDQSQDGVATQAPGREIGCVETLFKDPLGRFPIGPDKDTHQPHLA